jgi:two-component system, cell cycle sensor histidine kinase and response regulator CckA
MGEATSVGDACRRATKVLLCSGYSVDGQAQAILPGGCNGFIQKPLDIATPSAKLSEIL